jgi:hypothetical protein
MFPRSREARKIILLAGTAPGTRPPGPGARSAKREPGKGVAWLYRAAKVRHASPWRWHQVLKKTATNRARPRF